ncbi:MAG: PIN domain-containing protein [Acidobacteriaceae bacterium]
MDLLLIRIAFFLLSSIACYFFPPFGLPAWASAAMGAAIAVLVLLLEARVRALNPRRLLGAAAGALVGILGALLVWLVLRISLPHGRAQSLLEIFVLLLLSYIGLVVGASKGDLLSRNAPDNPSIEKPFAAPRPVGKILDTSSIIDGRIADMAETGFLEGPLLIPEFVLEELQMVADSQDGSKRQRGRRGLDVLQRMQSNTSLDIQIIRTDYPKIRGVDLKLIELAKESHAKIVTTDFNLNKVAHLHTVEVLNINDLVNALKPVVLPGERMNIAILKEGKEYNQGVGYLDDGTMVVVDHARRLIGRSIEISVTSVLQTASGKMIFGRMDEPAREPARVEQPAQV